MLQSVIERGTNIPGSGQIREVERTARAAWEGRVAWTEGERSRRSSCLQCHFRMIVICNGLMFTDVISCHCLL